MKIPVIILLALAVQSVGFATDLRTESGFRIPAANTVFDFPRDHGSHPEFRIEWWYITGHLRDEEARRFGFQATFFRYALNTNINFVSHELERFDQKNALKDTRWNCVSCVNTT